MQSYEQYIIGRMVNSANTLLTVCSTNQCQHPNIWCNNNPPPPPPPYKGPTGQCRVSSGMDTNYHSENSQNHPGLLHHQQLHRLQQTNVFVTSIQVLLLRCTFKVLHTHSSLGFYSRLFIVPKSGNRWKPVIYLCLNKSLVIQIQDKTLNIYVPLSGKWVTSIKPIEAYNHSPIHTQFQKYRWFCHKVVI